jgi:hypothetical protein
MTQEVLRSTARRIMRCATRRIRRVMLRTGARSTPRRIRRGKFVDATESVRWQCLVSAQCLGPFADAAEPVRRQCLRERAVSR